MKCSLPVLFITILIIAAFPNTLYSANFSIRPVPFAPFDDDPAIYNDCKYCHGQHNARNDVHALLNDKEERYSRYLDSTALSGRGGQSVFELESSRKCPRSRVKGSR